MEPLLVLCIDRDNDLFEKAKISGPVIGREENLKAATALALKDPTDPDINTMFEAVKIYDSLKKKNKVQIATLTGHKTMGYKADREISRQLDNIIIKTGATRCILVTDGASDNEVIPIIRSRMKIDSVIVTYVKQAKELEKTYFVILEKLKDPHYAKILLGIPALVILLISLFSWFGFVWQPVGVLIGIYLLLKGFGMDERIADFLSGINLSFEKPSWILNITAIALIGFSAINGYIAMQQEKYTLEKKLANFILSVVPMLVVATIVMLIGRTIDAIEEGKRYLVSTYFLYIINSVLLMFVVFYGTKWVLNDSPPYVSFGDFIKAVAFSLVLSYISTRVSKYIKKEALLKANLKGKEVINTNGNYVGSIVGTDPSDSTIVLKGIYGNKKKIPVDEIKSLSGDKIVIWWGG